MCDDIEPQTRRAPWAASTSLTLLVIQNSLSLLLLHRIQQPSLNDQYQYEPLTAVILSEALKLIVCVVVLGFGGVPQLGKLSRIQLTTDNLRDGHLKAAAPAVLYTVAAVLQSLGARNLDGISSPVSHETGSILQGYHILVWGFIFLQAAGGFIVAWSVRASSTVAKTYAQTMGFMIASIGPSLLATHTVPLRTLTGAALVTAGVLGSFGDSRKISNAVSDSDACEDVEKAASQISK
ncbi:UDP-galactose transporter [Colletotrichum fructicola]|nr:UDP-galactose transporter [Colletotrichum fructicola]